MSMYSRKKAAPQGFRAVRMYGKTEVVYCIKLVKSYCGDTDTKNIDMFHADGTCRRVPVSILKDYFVKEYDESISPGVQAMLDAMPTYERWWDERQTASVRTAA